MHSKNAFHLRFRTERNLMYKIRTPPPFYGAPKSFIKKLPLALPVYILLFWKKKKKNIYRKLSRILNYFRHYEFFPSLAKYCFFFPFHRLEHKNWTFFFLFFSFAHYNKGQQIVIDFLIIYFKEIQQKVVDKANIAPFIEEW